MNSPRKTITIRLSPRDLMDSPEILNKVNDAFPEADFELDLRDDSIKTSESVEQHIAKKAEESAKAALDLQDQAFREEMVTTSTPEENKSKIHQWLKTLREQGIRVTGNIIAGYIINRITGG